MSHLRDATQQVLDAATAAGVRATADPRNVNPPCLLVTPDTTLRRTSHLIEVALTLQLVAPGPANLDALWALDDLVDVLTPALDQVGRPWTTGTVTSTPHPASGDPLLTYELSVTIPVAC